jgi:type I restriction enzyme, R subunit
MTDEDRVAAEQRARVLIDRQLAEAGWVVQDRKGLNLFAGQGVAVREVVMAKGHGRADYLLYVDRLAVGVIEAKPVGTTLSGWRTGNDGFGIRVPPTMVGSVVGSTAFGVNECGVRTHEEIHLISQA